MAINLYINRTFLSRIKNKFSYLFQYIYRIFTFESPYVFFRYKTIQTHPEFWRFYEEPTSIQSDFTRSFLFKIKSLLIAISDFAPIRYRYTLAFILVKKE